MRQDETRRGGRNETKRVKSSTVESTPIRVEARRGDARRCEARRGESKLPTRLHRSREGMRPPRRDEDTGGASKDERKRGEKGRVVMEERRGSKTESG